MYITLFDFPLVQEMKAWVFWYDPKQTILKGQWQTVIKIVYFESKLCLI